MEKTRLNSAVPGRAEFSGKKAVQEEMLSVNPLLR